MVCSRIILCLCLFLLVRGSYQIHEHMTPEELQSVFQTNGDSVPEYEVVPVLHSMQDDKGDEKNLKVHFKAFGADVSLNLEPVEQILFGEGTPIYTVRSSPLNSKALNYDLVSGLDLEKRAKIYEDRKKMASIESYQTEDGKIHFNGPYGVNFRIRSLPSGILKFVSENKTYHNPMLLPRIPGQDDNVRMTNHHVIVKFTIDELTGHHFGQEEATSMINRKKIDDKATTVLPEVIYPEILVIVDYDSYKSHGFDLQETIRYYVSFFNAVDLKYRKLDGPKVRLNIAAIIVAMDREATPYLNKRRINNDLIESGALDELSLYLYEETRFPRHTYDLAVAITNSNLCEYSKNGKKNAACHRVRGISKYGTACDWDDRTKRVESVVLIHDAGFNGIPTTAHELAHIFGVPHDGSPSLPSVGGPGAVQCKWEDGYLMSSFRHDGHAFNWSDCSRKCLSYFFKTSQASCLFNKPQKTGVALPQPLPGTLMSVDEQCFRSIGGQSCWHNENVCTLLWCRLPNTESDCIANTPAAEGSECGFEKFCIGGHCVNKSQNN